MTDALRAATDEKPLQKVLEQYPELLAPLVTGNHGTWVIPQTRLAGTYIPDFVIAGITSAGIEWVLIELETPAVRLHTNDNGYTAQVRHGMKQIKDWRGWLENNLDMARRPQSEHGLGLPGIRARPRGIVIASRSSGPTMDVDRTRQDTYDEERIEVMTYDRLVRMNRAPSPFGDSPFDEDDIGSPF
ncbi:Shedu anti-phage system protein SduA domain-containing protein [Nocardia asteroides]|uniref:Shedu anti-phage system protein SduA domain-containing protein n=1 Tax=Nocardia asteroides TaxID=1824 RepID=UPI0034479961